MSKTDVLAFIILLVIVFMCIAVTVGIWHLLMEPAGWQRLKIWEAAMIDFIVFVIMTQKSKQ